MRENYLLDRGKDHVSAAARGQPVQPSPDPVYGDNVPAMRELCARREFYLQVHQKQCIVSNLQVLGAGVISTVHDSADWASQRDPELGSRRSSASSLRHLGS